MIQVKPEEGKPPNQAGHLIKEKDGKGILIFEYDVIVLNQKKDKNDEEEEIEF